MPTASAPEDGVCAFVGPPDERILAGGVAGPGERTWDRVETRQKTRRLVHPAPGQDPDAFELNPEVLVYHTEEKGSDVNLATRLILDGLDGLWEEAIVISNDSDLESPIRECNTQGWSARTRAGDCWS